MRTCRLLLALFVAAVVGCEDRPAPAPPPTQVQDWRRAPGVCEVHQREMNTVQVHGLAGHINFVSGYFEAREKLFPHAGIEYGPNLYSEEIGLIYVCPDCVAAREAWRP